MAYSDYLQSTHWKETRKIILKKRGNECIVCEKKSRIHIHHRRYTDKNGSILGRETPQDLFPLCASCHKLWHLKHGDAPIQNWMIARLRRFLKLGMTTAYAIQFCADRTISQLFLDQYTVRKSKRVIRKYSKIHNWHKHMQEIHSRGNLDGA